MTFNKIIFKLSSNVIPLHSMQSTPSASSSGRGVELHEVAGGRFVRVHVGFQVVLKLGLFDAESFVLALHLQVDFALPSVGFSLQQRSGPSVAATLASEFFVAALFVILNSLRRFAFVNSTFITSNYVLQRIDALCK